MTPSTLLHGIDSRASRIETPCGTGSMVWRRWGTAAAGDPNPVILLHGGFGSWAHWVRNIEALAATRPVIAADLPGLGDSAMPPRPYDIDIIAGIVAAGLTILLDPGERPHLVCFSFGAVIGGAVAVALGRRIESFTLVGPAGFGPRENPVRGMVKVRPEMTEAQQWDAARRNMRALMLSDDAAVDDLAVHIQLANTRRARIRSRPMSLSPRLAEDLPRMTARLGAIWGALDSTCVGEMDKRHEVVRAAQPDADIRVLDGVGHWVQYEAAAAFNAALLGILDTPGKAAAVSAVPRSSAASP